MKGFAILDQQFNPRLAVPDAELLLVERRRESMAVAERVAVRRMAYGPGPREHFFVVGESPNGGSRTPAVIFIHGGYWRAGAAEDNFHLAPAIAEMGARAVFLGYPLCPGSRLPEIIEAVRRGVNAVLDAASELGIDAGRVVLVGTSAGAHLTASLLAYGDVATRIHGALLLTGIYDLTPVPLLAVNGEIGLDAAVARNHSPLFCRYSRVPSVFAVGAREPPMWRAQTFAMAALARASGAATAVIDAPDRNHFDLLTEIVLPGSAINQALASLVRSMK